MNDLNVLPILGETYIVKTTSLNIRLKPSTDATVVTKLKQGDKVKLIYYNDNNWWFIQKDNYSGYVSSEFLIKDIYSGWEKKSYVSGTTPECENVTPQFDYNLNNYLRINVGSNTDVVVKLMKMGNYGDECIRIVYVRSTESYDIKNIPEGKYYVKLAYGQDYRQKIIDNKCHVRFMSNPIYKKGEDIFDFNKISKPDEKIGDKVYKKWDLPSYSLSLVVRTTFGDNRFDSNKISEKEFNQ
jgi:hypothetical protein